MSEHQITLTTRDGQQLSFNCADDCDVVSAAEQVNIKLPSLCRDGACGACLGHCQDGQYRLGQVSGETLSEQAIADRDVLLCRTYPQSDLHIQAPYDHAHILFGKQSIRQATICQLESIAERTMRLKLTLVEDENGKAVEFEPGQCMELEIPGTEIRRAYSLANTGNWRGELEFLIRLQAQGQFSGYLAERAAIGDSLNVIGPGGAFGLNNDSFNPAIFVAGGSGLAPFLSILRRMAEWGEDKPIHLLFGVNQQSELFCLAELESLQQQLPSFGFTLCVWKPAADWQGGFVGTPAEALDQYLKQQPDNYDIYLCGPPMLVSAATEVAMGLGIPPEQVYAEKFV